jgi:hypothetical protein
LAGFGSVAPAAAIDLVPRVESKSNGQGGTTDIVVIRTSLYDLYGVVPQGFEPKTSRPFTGDRALPLTTRGEGIYSAKLYWVRDRDTNLFVPRVSLLFYRSLDLDEVLADDDVRVSFNSPDGTPFTAPNGDLLVNPVSLDPVESVSPTVTGFAAF